MGKALKELFQHGCLELDEESSNYRLTDRGVEVGYPIRSIHARGKAKDKKKP